MSMPSEAEDEIPTETPSRQLVASEGGVVALWRTGLHHPEIDTLQRPPSIHTSKHAVFSPESDTNHGY